MRRILVLICACLAFSVVADAATLADPFALENFQVNLDGRRVTASFELTPGLPDELIERIQSGLPTGLTYQFKLYRDHIRWFDRGLDEASLHVTAMYNAVTREYLINYKFDGKLTESRVVRSLTELGDAMTHFKDLQIFTLGSYPTGRRLLVRARADLGSRTIFSFIPTAVTTDWVESKKFLPPATVP